MIPLRRRTVLALTLALALIPASGAAAQRPPGADTLSPAAVAESLKVLKTLRAALDKRKNQNNAALWYHRGMLTWALYLRDRSRGGLRELDWTLLGREMDSSIRIASSIAPENVRYQLTKGQYFASTGWMLVKIQSFHVFDVALERARKGGDAQLIAESAIEKGTVHWRRYGAFGFAQPPPMALVAGGPLDNRPPMSRMDIINRELINYDPRNLAAMQSTMDGRDFFRNVIPRQRGDFSGEIDYAKAEDFFREAYAAKPAYLRAFTSLAMVMEERRRWSELAGLAQTRINAEPTHAWAWLTLGLALHRTGNSIGALSAFERGLANLGPGERRRLDNIARVMRPRDSTTVRAWTPAQRREFEDWYWIWSAPLWSLDETKPRAEFLARVTAAELRWTTDDFARRGADTDRGNIFVRYGPSNPGRSAFGAESWRYDYAGLAFYFQGTPVFGTSYFTNYGEALNVMDSIPARWDNLVRVRVDSMPLRVARFRTAAESNDSLDVVFTMHPKVPEILRSAELDVPVHLHSWLLGAAFPEPKHDTTSLRTAGPVTFVRRLPTGEYPYRFEATQEAATVGARAASRVIAKTDSTDEFYTSGFGLSDLLIGDRAIPNGTPRRWSDFEFRAEPGTFAPGANLALIWENYDLGSRDGSAEYTVKLVIEHKWQMFLNRIRARIISSFAAMVGTEETSDRVIFRYDRRMPHAATIPDYITLSLADAPPGFYDVTVEITDKVTGKVASRTTRIRVRD